MKANHSEYDQSDSERELMNEQHGLVRYGRPGMTQVGKEVVVEFGDMFDSQESIFTEHIEVNINQNDILKAFDHI